jgi:hypothetical protein
MDPIEKFIRDSYTPIITEGKLGMTCLFKHKEGITEDSVVFFEFAKKGWSRKPIVNKRQYVIVDADTRDLLEFLSNYFNLTEENYNDVRKIIVDMGIEAMETFYGDSSM